MIAAHCKNTDCVYNLATSYVLLARPSSGTWNFVLGWIFLMGDKYKAFLERQWTKRGISSL